MSRRWYAVHIAALAFALALVASFVAYGAEDAPEYVEEHPLHGIQLRCCFNKQCTDTVVRIRKGKNNPEIMEFVPDLPRFPANYRFAVNQDQSQFLIEETMAPVRCIKLEAGV